MPPSLHEIVAYARKMRGQIPLFGGTPPCGHYQFIRTCRQCTNVTVEGVASTGQISKQGYVAHQEHWGDRLDASVNPEVIRLGVRLGQVNDDPPPKPGRRVLLVPSGFSRRKKT